MIWWFSLLQETNMNMWQEGSVLPVTLLSSSPPGSIMFARRFPPTKFKSEQTPKASKWSLAPAPSSLRATSIYLGGKCSWWPPMWFKTKIRIKAVNKSSKGHWNYSIPSEPSDSMIAKIRYSEIRFLQKNLLFMIHDASFAWAMSMITNEIYDKSSHVRDMMKLTMEHLLICFSSQWRRSSTNLACTT